MSGNNFKFFNEHKTRHCFLEYFPLLKPEYDIIYLKMKYYSSIKRFKRIFFERSAKFHAYDSKKSIFTYLYANNLIFLSLQIQNTSYSALYITKLLNEPIINILILKWCLSKYRKCVRKFETNVFICALFWTKISCHYGKEEAN